MPARAATRPPWPALRARVMLVAGALLVGLGGVLVARSLTASEAPPASAPAPGQATGPAPGPPTVLYELRGGVGDPVRVRLEVAADPAARRRGLSGRPSVPAGTGMVFLFPEDVAGAFWMKDTLVPLSIAFLDADGRVLAVREMTPCRADPCPRYRPGTSYRSAVELPAGAFAEAGVEPGDLVVPADPGSLPTPR